MIERDRCPLRADPLLPAHRNPGFDGEAGGDVRGQDGVLIFGILLFEEFPTGEGDKADVDAFCHQGIPGFDDEADFGAGGHEDEFRVAFAQIREDVRALVQTAGRGKHIPVEGGNVLAGEGEGGGAVAAQDGGFPGFGGFVGVGGAEGDEVGDGAEAGEVLNGLVRGAIFAEADAVVGEDPDRGVVAEGGEADGGTGVIGEDEEGRAVGNQAAVNGHAVEDRAHAMFADAEVEVTSVGRFGLEGGEAVEPGFGGAS